jgi:nitrate reductase NapE component
MVLVIFVHGFGFCSLSLAMVDGFSPCFMVLVIFVHGFGFCSWSLAMVDGFGPWFMVTYCRVTSGENELV